MARSGRADVRGESDGRSTPEDLTSDNEMNRLSKSSTVRQADTSSCRSIADQEVAALLGRILVCGPRRSSTKRSTPGSIRTASPPVRERIRDRGSDLIPEFRQRFVDRLAIPRRMQSHPYTRPWA